MNGIFLLLGSNLGDRAAHIDSAIEAINHYAGRIVRLSALYRSEPWGFGAQPEFYNRLVELDSDRDPESLMRLLLEIERRQGRHRRGKWKARKIDIDILYYGGVVMVVPGLVLPHPEIQNRRFALVPLCELVPEMEHPVLKKSHTELLRDCPDPLGVWLLNQEGVGNGAGKKKAVP